MKKQVMVRAWEIARAAVVRFGGKVREFFAAALAMAWEEMKGAAKMVELKGSQSQIRWAEDIRAMLTECKELALSADVEMKEEKKEITAAYNEIMNIEEAKELINRYSRLRKYQVENLRSKFNPMFGFDSDYQKRWQLSDAVKNVLNLLTF